MAGGPPARLGSCSRNGREADPDGGSQLCVEARVEAIGRQGSIGVAAVRPIVRTFGSLVATEGIAAAVRRAERS